MSAYRATDPTLDGAAVRARRLELGWSERTFAGHLGQSFSTSVVRSIESGNATAELTLGDVRRVADVLGLRTADIVVLGLPTAQPALDNDVPLLRQLGATLAALDVPVPLEALARALGNDLDDLAAMLASLGAHVAVVGMEVQTVGGMVRLAPSYRSAAVDALQALTRAHLGRTQLDISQANLVSRTARGEKWKLRGNAEQVTKGMLLNGGIIKTNASGGFELTPDVTFSLMLDDGA